MAKPPPIPKGLKSSGRALWSAVTKEFDLAEHERAMLRQAGETLDSIDALQAALDDDAVIVSSPQGQKAHPALVELRQQRIVFARLLAQLGVPVDDDESPRSRGARGAYRMGRF